MNNKRQFTLQRLQNKPFKSGDKVRVIDGSSITEQTNQTAIYIVFSYSQITGVEKKLKEITATVLETGIEHFFAEGVQGIIFPQDLKIQIGNGIFYTSSAHVISVAEKE